MSEPTDRHEPHVPPETFSCANSEPTSDNVMAPVTKQPSAVVHEGVVANSSVHKPHHHSHLVQGDVVPDYIKTIRELQDEEHSPSIAFHFLALMKKNALLKWRAPISTIAEVLLPVLFACGLLIIWKLASSGFEPTKQFATTPLHTHTQTLDALCVRAGPGVPSLAADGIRDCNATDLATPNLVCKNTSFIPITGLCSTLPPNTVTLKFLYGFRARRYVPPMDDLIRMQWAYWLQDRGRRAGSFQSNERALSNSGEIYFAPSNAATLGIVDYFNRTSKLFKYINAGTHASLEAVDAILQNPGLDPVKTRTMAVVGITQWSNTSVDLVYSFNRSSIPWTSEKEDQYSNGLADYAGARFILGGVATIQNMIGARYLEEFGKPAPGLMVVAPMPYTEYDSSEFLSLIGDLAPLFLVFGYLYAVSQLTKKIVEEKESRMREAMMIMGLGTGSFYTSWILTYIVVGFAGALLITIILATTMLPKSLPIITFFLFFLFAVSTVTLSSLLASFFSKSRVSALVSPVVFFVMAIPSFAIPQDSPVGALLLLSFMSPSAFARGAKLLFNQEKTTGANGTNFGSDTGYPMALVFFMLIIDTVIYFFLTLYLDAVLPSEWGTRLHPCFCYCFRWCPWVKQPTHDRGFDEEGNMKDGRAKDGAFEDVQRPGKQPSVRLYGLRKEFDTPAGRITAVNDFSYDLYQDEITVLLGHNGAGKTTAINLMTGMLEMNGGDCQIYGTSVHDDVHAARQEIGMCPQHNILWDELTCREHLYFFAKIKGFSGEALERAADAMLRAVDLGEKADVLSSGLSGGQKRKLSVAIAFVGGSRMIFLDEPTAGMDVAARRFTWDLIKQMSPGRTIVLTTHFMDEADLLGNTVAIMSKGALKCAGSSLFLKNRLGVGYTLSLACEPAADTKGLQQLVKGFVPAADTMTASGGELAMRLPMSSVPSFPAMLAALEADGPSRGVRGHGISVTTLEEVFLKIGHDESAALNEDVDAEAKEKVMEDVKAGAVGEEALTPHTKSKVLWEESNTAASSLWSQPKALLIKRLHNAKRDRRTQVLQIILPIVCILLALLLTLINFTDLPDLVLEPSTYGFTDTAYTNCGADYAQFALPNANPEVAPGNTAVSLSQYLLDTAKTHTNVRLTSFMCSGTQPFVMNNETGWFHSMPHAIHEYYAMHTRAAMNDTKLSYRATLRPLTLTDIEAKRYDSFQALMIGIFIMIPFTFIPSTFVSWVVKERECKAKHLQTVCGMNYIMYWCSNFVFDFISFTITTFLALLIFLIFSRDEYVGNATTFFATFVLFILYGIAAVSGSYLVSFLFESHATAQNIVMMGNFIMGFLLVLIAYFLSIIPSTEDVGKPLTYLFRVWPAFCLGNGIINLASGGIFSSSGGTSYSPWDMDVTGWNMIFMALEAPLFFALTLLIDHPSLLKTVQSFGKDADPEPIEDEDPDVAEERRLVESGERDDDFVVVKNFRKLFKTKKGSKLAVKNLSFAVKPGEVFGFLGTNGAGKTTSISMLCGEFLPTSGHGWIAGKDVVTEGGEARKLLGYCPQFDALLELLTVEEHLELYAGLRGLTGDAKKSVVEGLIESCGLQPHRKKESRSLSGGNKRKLSVAMALVGGPQVVFLDEPSAGMDPMARRGLWDVLEVVAKHCCIVLTTHHLEEVEALSTRVSIMDQGEMKCLGSLQHLKSKFGSGFEMSLRVRSETDVEAAEQFIEQNIAAADLQESRNGKLTYALPPDTKLSQVFQLLEGHKEQLRVTDYSVSQTSLESVFLKISEAGREKEEAESEE